MSMQKKRGGVFVQYCRNDVLITLPEEVKEVTDKNAWHFYMDETGRVYETYMVKVDRHDATSYDFYIKDTEERVGGATYGGRYHVFEPEWWTTEELLREYGHRTVLPFIAIYGTSKDSYAKMPEYGEEIYKMGEAGLCLKLFFIAGYQKFVPCEYHVEKNRDGQICFVIHADGQQVYRMDIGWNNEKPSFADYQNQMRDPWNIDKVNEVQCSDDDENDSNDEEDEDQ